MNILSLIDGMEAAEVGKLLLGSLSDVVLQKSQEIVNMLLEDEIERFMEDASLAPEGDFRNGFYERTFSTARGPMVLRIPRDRLNAFKTKMLAPYQRRMAEIDQVIQSLYIRGLTENEIVDQIGFQFGASVSRETVRKIVNGTLGDAIRFNTRVIPDCPIVYLDGTYVPVKRRKNDSAKVERECIMVAMGITREGKRQILGFFAPSEGSHAWQEMLENLKERGLCSPSLFVTDGLQGMPDAIRRVFPDARHQLCLVHVQRNIAGDVRKSDRQEIADDFRKAYTAKSKEEAESLLEAFSDKWKRTYPSMTRKIMERDGLFTFMEYPRPLWRTVYTSNAIESSNAKLKRITRKRILMNSVDNAILTIVSVSAEYNRNSGKIRFRGFTEMDEKEKEGIFLPLPGQARKQDGHSLAIADE